MRAAYYRDLIVWKKSIELVEQIYELTKMLPKSERYGLSSQMQRAAISIPSNIAEGYLRRTDLEYRQFLYVALASAAELETQVVIIRRLDFSTPLFLDIIEGLLVEIIKMLRTMVKTVSKS